MLRKIKVFFESKILVTTQSDDEQVHQLNLATAAILLEASAVDGMVSKEEEQLIDRLLFERLSLEAEEVVELKQLTQATLKSATDYYQFTSLIKAHFNAQQRIHLVEQLWQVATADGVIDQHEEYFIRKISDLLFVPHSEFIKAKLKVLNH